MKNTDKVIFYKYSYPTIGNKIINLFLAASANAITITSRILPFYLVIALLIDKILYETIQFKHGFIACILIILFGWIIFNLLYVFTKKGVYIFDDNKIVIKNGCFVRGNFHSIRGIKYTFYTWQIKNINIYIAVKVISRLGKLKCIYPNGKAILLSSLLITTELHLRLKIIWDLSMR